MEKEELKRSKRKKKLKKNRKYFFLLIGILIIGGIGIMVYKNPQQIQTFFSDTKPSALNALLERATISPIRTAYNGNYKVKIVTGNESLYDVTFNKTQVSLGNITYYNEELKKNISVEQFRQDTIICLEAGWDEKEIIEYKWEEKEEKEVIDKSYNYSVPSTLYFSKESIKKPDINRTHYDGGGGLSIVARDFVEGDTYKFCYQANPEKDFYLKFGDNSVIVIQGKDIVGDSLLTNVTSESGDANFTHLNISTTAPYDDLVGYWSFDGDNVNSKLNTSYDFSQYNNDGTMVGNAVVNSTNCMYGDCLQLDGDGDYVSKSSMGDMVPGHISNKTLSFWVKFNDVTLGDPMSPWQYAGAGSGGSTYWRTNFGVNYVGGNIYDGSVVPSVSVTTSPNFVADTWYHLIMWYNFEATTVNLSVWVDGVFQGSDLETVNSSKILSSNDFYIGSSSRSSAQRYFNGSIDEVMIFNTSLTEAQILDIYNNQSARFFETGEQAYDNSSQTIPISSGNNEVNVTTTLENNLDSKVNLSVAYYDGSWTLTSPQTITSGVNYTYTISDTSTNLTLNYTLIAGNSTNPFYSPLIKGDIILDYYSIAVGDVTDPIITLNAPVDFYNSTSTSFNPNCTASDDVNLTNVTLYGNWSGGWHSNETNSSGINGTDYIFSKTIIDGDSLYIWSCEGCDNSSNCAFATANRTFRIDTTPPYFTDIANQSIYNNETLGYDINATDDGVGVDCFVVNDTTNFNISCGGWMANITGLSVQEYYINITVNDTLNQINSTVLLVNVSEAIVDTTNPEITITNPLNNSNLSSAIFDLNYTYIETNPDSCWYSNDSGATNSTLVSMGTNWTALTGVEGNINRTIYCNDTTNNLNSTIVHFTIDITYPDISIAYPPNHTNSTDIKLDVNYTASDTNLDSCWYSNDTYEINTTLTDCTTNITSVTWAEGSHNVTVWANDSAGNENNSIIFFRIDTTPPTITNPRNFTQAANQSFSENMPATDTSEISYYWLNQTNYFNISQTGVIANVTNLSREEIHWLNYSVNDTLNNLQSLIFFINITEVSAVPKVTTYGLLTLVLVAPNNQTTSNKIKIITIT